MLFYEDSCFLLCSPPPGLALMQQVRSNVSLVAAVSVNDEGL